jgi:hypothetical protein
MSFVIMAFPIFFCRTFTLNGEGAFWNGTKWATLDRGRMVKLAEGSLILTDFRTSKMTPEICGRLTERGRKYASLAGIHHKLYRGRRVMIDRLGWNTFGYNHADDTPFPFPLLQDRSKARNNNDILPVREDDIALLPRFMPGFDLERKVITQSRHSSISDTSASTSRGVYLMLMKSSQ